MKFYTKKLEVKNRKLFKSVKGDVDHDYDHNHNRSWVNRCNTGFTDIEVNSEDEHIRTHKIADPRKDG